MGAQERWVSPGRAGHRDRRPAPSPGRPRAARLEGLARLPRSRAVRDTAPSLTCPLRQRPQEVEGCSLDTDTTRQQHAEAAPHVGGRGCRAAAQLQDGHRGPEQKRLGPGRGALGLQGEGRLSTGPAGGPAAQAGAAPTVGCRSSRCARVWHRRATQAGLEDRRASTVTEALAVPSGKPAGRTRNRSRLGGVSALSSQASGLDTNPSATAPCQRLGQEVPSRWLAQGGVQLARTRV